VVFVQPGVPDGFAPARVDPRLGHDERSRLAWAARAREKVPGPERVPVPTQVPQQALEEPGWRVPEVVDLLFRVLLVERVDREGFLPPVERVNVQAEDLADPEQVDPEEVTDEEVAFQHVSCRADLPERCTDPEELGHRGERPSFLHPAAFLRGELSL